MNKPSKFLIAVSETSRDLIAINNEVIKALTDIADDLKAWRPEAHEIDRKGQCKNKRCKANLKI